MIQSTRLLASSAGLFAILAGAGAAQTTELFQSEGTLRPQGRWAATFGGSGADRINQVARVPRGFFLAGETFSFAGGTEQIWVALIDDRGGVRWERALGGASGASFGALHPTADGGCVIVGSAGTLAQPNAWVAKLNESGAIQWQRAYGGSSEEKFTARGSNLLQHWPI